MADDRFIHRRLGHSEKVNLLTDLEFRVWVQYILSADDFGVMRFSAVTLQADNDHLSNRPKRIIDNCLQSLVKLKLARLFQHQGRTYVYQADWQDYQHVGYPRGTNNPLPPDEQIAECSPKTQKHFSRHPLKTRPVLAELSANVSQILPEDSPPSRAREMANDKWLMTNGQRPRGEQRLEPLPPAEDAELALEERAGRLLERYAELFQEHRRGAIYRARPAIDFGEALALVRLWDDERLEKLAILVLTTDDPWIAKTDRAFKIFALKATWADDRLRQWELEASA